MTGLGEMAAWRLLPGTIPWFCSRYVDDAFGYKVPFQPYLTYAAFSNFVIVVIFSGFPVFVGTFDYQEFITPYINITVFFILYLGFKFVCKTQICVPSEIDIPTGNAEIHIQEDQWVGSPPRSVLEKV